MSTEAPPRPGMEPRLRERRISVRRAEGRRRLRVVLVIVSVLCLVGLAWAFVHSAFLDVDTVRVADPGTHTSAAQVVAASGIRPGDPMVFLDEAAAAKRIERLPWVERARVTRQYPGDVTITVTEAEPTAFVATGSGATLIDASARVMGTVPSAPPGLVEVSGLRRLARPGHTIDPAAAVTMLGELPPALRTRVARVTAAGEDVSLTLVDGREVRFGPATSIRAKAAAAEAVLAHIGDQPVAYVDVRVPTAPVTG